MAPDKEIITVTGEVCAAVGGRVYSRKMGVGRELSTFTHFASLLSLPRTLITPAYIVRLLSI